MRAVGVYAGSFDPLTYGHDWMIRAGSNLFNKLYVSVGDNPDKKCMFSVDERIEMVRECTQPYTNIEVDSFPHQFLANYVASLSGARYILRGIRNSSDYTFENAMRHINDDINPEITTVFLMPPRELSEISSSIVKGLVGPTGWEDVVRKYVPWPVVEKLKEKYRARQNATKVG